jgi:hypothetical protein
MPMRVTLLLACQKCVTCGMSTLMFSFIVDLLLLRHDNKSPHNISCRLRVLIVQTTPAHLIARDSNKGVDTLKGCKSETETPPAVLPHTCIQ